MFQPCPGPLGIGSDANQTLGTHITPSGEYGSTHPLRHPALVSYRFKPSACAALAHDRPWRTQ